MKVTWLNTLRDWLSLVVTLALLIVPFSSYSVIVFSVEQQQQSSRALRLAEETLSHFEIVLDHLNGALINLKTTYDRCDTDTLSLMHRLSFDLPGVEAFAFVDADNNVLCTNWLHNLGNLSLNLPIVHPGLNLTGEEYIGLVGKTGVLAYRPGSDEARVVSLISSTYLRQSLAQNLPVEDSIVLYNRTVGKHIAMNGLLNAGELEQLEQALLTPESPYSNLKRRQVYAQSSMQYPSVSVGYFSKSPTYFQALTARLAETSLFVAVSLLAAWGWLAYRHNKVNSIEYQIRVGLKHQEFEPALQPIIDMNTGQWVGAELLARWQRSGKTVAYPDEFIRAAESSRRIKELTRQLVERLFRELEAHPLPTPTFYFSVNLSPNHVDEQTELTINELTAQYPAFNETNIRFEITEHGLAQTGRRRFQEVVGRLKARGYLFGLDDFGTGQSGLEYFSNLSPDFLKIDRRFVMAIDAPESVDFQLLKTIVQLAQSLKLIMIAEGVETAQQAQWLQRQGIQYAQGWFYEKAMPLPVFRQRLNARG